MGRGAWSRNRNPSEPVSPERVRSERKYKGVLDGALKVKRERENQQMELTRGRRASKMWRRGRPPGAGPTSRGGTHLQGRGQQLDSEGKMLPGPPGGCCTVRRASGQALGQELGLEPAEGPELGHSPRPGGQRNLLSGVQ